MLNGKWTARAALAWLALVVSFAALAAATPFWVDPKEQPPAVLMTQAPSPQRAYFRKMVKQLVYQAIVD
jgi:hypothetical protein